MLRAVPTAPFQVVVMAFLTQVWVKFATKHPLFQTRVVCYTAWSRRTTVSPLFSSSPASTTQLPRLTAEHLQQLQEKQYVVIPIFLPNQL